MVPWLRKTFVVCVLLLVAAACARAASIITTPFSGVRYTYRTQKLPRPLSIHIVEIDLTDPGIRFLVSPKNVGTELGENKRQTTRTFVTGVNAQIGINGSFYFASPSGANYDSRGLIASDGNAYSSWGDDMTRPWPAIHISADNIASVIDRVYPYRSGIETEPPVPLYNAISGSERIVTNGRVTAGAVGYGEPTYLHPRTVVGVTGDRKLVMLVVDGRQTGFSEGMRGTETAALLIQYGVIDAVNLDGGGSSTFVMANPTPRTLNKPSDGTDRSVAVSMAVFANPATTSEDAVVFSDFYAGDRGNFAQAPTGSSSTQGVLSTSSNEALESAEAVARGWFQRLTLRDDPAIQSATENPTGGWFVRHLSGPTGASSENISRPRTGNVGFWARTNAAGVEASVAINAGGATRGVRRALVADGAWHLYEWKVDAGAQWQSWGAGGAIAGDTFTIDSVHLFGPNADAVVDLDLIAHNAKGSLASLTPEPPPLPADTGAGQLVNLSVRSTAGTGDQTLIVGLAAGGGSGSGKPVLVRAAGPALQRYGITNALPDPSLQLQRFGAVGAPVAQNDNWAHNDPVLVTTTARVGAFPFDPQSLDAATLVTFQPDSYTAQVAGGATGSAGVALLEVYDAEENRTPASSRLTNLSARTRVGTGDDSLIVGFSIDGGPRRVLIRAIGPTLNQFGVAGVADPQMLLYRGQNIIAYNDDWGGGATLRMASSKAGAFALPANSEDASLLVTLDPGSYTVVVRGAYNATTSPTGIALVEVYEVP